MRELGSLLLGLVSLSWFPPFSICARKHSCTFTEAINVARDTVVVACTSLHLFRRVLFALELLYQSIFEAFVFIPGWLFSRLCLCKFARRCSFFALSLAVEQAWPVVIAWML